MVHMSVKVIAVCEHNVPTNIHIHTSLTILLQGLFRYLIKRMAARLDTCTKGKIDDVAWFGETCRLVRLSACLLDRTLSRL